MTKKDIDAMENAIYDLLKAYRNEKVFTDNNYLQLGMAVKSYSNEKERFIIQAEFLKDFECTVKTYTQFDLNTGTFEDMNVSQMKSYLAWRTKVRKCIYDEINETYINVYINELINLIGVNTENGLDKLILLWSKYSDSGISNKMLRFDKSILTCYDD